MKKGRRPLKLLSVAAIVLLALALRLLAVDGLAIDADEDDYLRAGLEVAALIEARDWRAFTQANYRPEHPPLAKIVYGAALSLLPPAPPVPDRETTAPPASWLPRAHLTVARLVSALFGTLAVLLFALVDPLAGLFLAVHTFTIKYTSQAMLEAQPAFTALLAVLAYRRSRGRPGGWLALSAVALGLTAAAKYPYALAGVAVLIDWLWRGGGRRRWAPAAAWALLALVAFLAADPYLWPDPVGRLVDSLAYHPRYARSEAVRCHGQPFWQPLGWLMTSAYWNPGVYVVSLDPLISLLALAGLRRLGRRGRALALWGVITLGFLLAWPTKWPQYVVLLSAPLALSAAEGVRWGKGLTQRRRGAEKKQTTETRRTRRGG